MDLCTGPLARASRLSADALTCGWPHGQPCGLPTRPPTGRRLRTSSTGLHHDRSNWARQELKTQARRSGLGNPTPIKTEAPHPPQHDTIHTICPAQHSSGSKPVTLPKSPVTIAEIRTRRWLSRSTPDISRRGRRRTASAGFLSWPRSLSEAAADGVTPMRVLSGSEDDKECANKRSCSRLALIASRR